MQQFRLIFFVLAKYWFMGIALADTAAAICSWSRDKKLSCLINAFDRQVLMSAFSLGGKSPSTLPGGGYFFITVFLSFLSMPILLNLVQLLVISAWTSGPTASTASGSEPRILAYWLGLSTLLRLHNVGLYWHKYYVKRSMCQSPTHQTHLSCYIYCVKQSE